MSLQPFVVLGVIAAAAYLVVRWAMSANDSNRRPSTFIFWLCFISAALGLFSSGFWINAAIRNSEGMAAMVFVGGIVPLLGGGTVLFCVVPSAVMYFRGHQRWDLVSLWISSITVAVIGLEALLLFPLRGR